MRGILRTVNFSPSAPVGYYFWCNNEYLPNTQKIFNFSEWSQPNNIPASPGSGGLYYDEFFGTVLGSIWTDQSAAGGAVNVSGGRLVMTTGTAGIAAVEQTNLNYPFDVWTRMEMPDPPFQNLNTDIQLVFNNWNYEATNWGDVGFGLGYNYYQGTDDYFLWAFQEANGSDWGETYVQVSQKFVYVRIQITITGSKLFYSLTEPLSDDDWTELVVSPVVNFKPGSAMDIWMAGNSGGAGNVGSKTFYFDFLRGWPNTQGAIKAIVGKSKIYL
jgi:hypothetical protein